jgi:hypothetical protein
MSEQQTMRHQENALQESIRNTASGLTKDCIHHDRAASGYARDEVELVWLRHPAPRQRKMRHATFRNFTVYEFALTRIKRQDYACLSAADAFKTGVNRQFQHAPEINRPEYDTGLRLELPSHGPQTGSLVDQLHASGIYGGNLWLMLHPENLAKNQLQDLACCYPRAVLECCVDCLSPLMASVPRRVESILDIYSEWGISRFALNWKSALSRHISGLLIEGGFDVTFTEVNDADELGQALRLAPRSIMMNTRQEMIQSASC